MTVLIIQTLLLMAIAFILGCILGCLLRNLFGSAEAETPSVGTAVAAGTGAAVAAGAARVAAPTPTPTPTPAPAPTPSAPLAPTPPPVPKPPMPTPPVTKPAAPAAPLVSATPTPKPKPKPKAAAKPKARKAPAKKSAPKPSAANKDNLRMISGIGPQNEARLNNLGIYQFAQIASWKAKDEAHYGEVLAFPGRIEREEWVKQAKELAKGKTTEFASRVAAGQVGTSLGKADAGSVGKEPKGLLKKARGGKPDNLTLIDGVGNAIEQKMFKLGIYHFDQVAEMSDAEITWLGNMVGFPGRPERENWREESKVLGAGGTTEHAKRVERGQIKTSRKSTDDEK
ncbi:hypothetical protein ACFQ14_05145 [Pseudahrensia aquimaris]|uniref:Flap endonuclease-1-like 5' DNA nuclease n=1 Tax=Pseudahrensia aquimaris TaxID=744461 RepID=A0ABW3FDZ5_9HYPH